MTGGKPPMVPEKRRIRNDRKTKIKREDYANLLDHYFIDNNCIELFVVDSIFLNYYYYFL